MNILARLYSRFRGRYYLELQYRKGVPFIERVDPYDWQTKRMGQKAPKDMYLYRFRVYEWNGFHWEFAWHETLTLEGAREALWRNEERNRRLRPLYDIAV